MTKKPAFIAIFLCALLAGCRHDAPPAPPLSGLVTSVSVSYTNEKQSFQRIYTDGEAVDILVGFVNSLSPVGRATTDPEYLEKESCKITLQLSGGQCKTYRLMGGKYLSVDCRPWQRLSKKADLAPLFEHLPREPAAAFLQGKHPKTGNCNRNRQRL